MTGVHDPQGPARRPRPRTAEEAFAEDLTALKREVGSDPPPVAHSLARAARRRSRPHRGGFVMRMWNRMMLRPWIAAGGFTAVAAVVFLAIAGDLIEIRIDREGKSDEELSAEIRDRLAEVGVPNPEVEVTTDGDRTEIRVEASHESDGGAMPADPPEVRLVLGDGHEMQDADRLSVNVRRMDSDAGGEDWIITVAGTRGEGEVTVHRPDGMNDSDFAREVASQLHAAGIDVQVAIDPDGRIEITN